MGAQRHADLVSLLERLAAEVASAQGVELVELSLRGSSHRRLLRVDIDRPGPGGVDIDDCQRVSQALGEALDESDLIASRYVLEVSSPGIDRPIVTVDDFRRNVGRPVRIVHGAVDGRHEELRGELLGVSDEVVRLRNGGGQEREVRLGDVVEARQDVVF